MMPASPKVEVVFSFVRSAEGLYTGSASLYALGEDQDPVLLETRRPSGGDVERPAWVRFVVDVVRSTEGLVGACFALRTLGRRHYLDLRTIERIQTGEMTAEDLLL